MKNILAVLLICLACLSARGQKPVSEILYNLKTGHSSHIDNAKAYCNQLRPLVGRQLQCKEDYAAAIAIIKRIRDYADNFHAHGYRDAAYDNDVMHDKAWGAEMLQKQMEAEQRRAPSKAELKHIQTGK